MGIRDFFQKKENPEEKLKEKILQAKNSRQQKKSKIRVISKKPVKILTPPNAPLISESSTFYSQEIHRVHHKDQWWFFLNDIIALTGGLDLEDYITKLKKSKDYEEVVGNFILDLPVKIDNQIKIIECINKKGTELLLPILRKNDRYFPGPFPAWISQISSTSPQMN